MKHAFAVVLILLGCGYARAQFGEPQQQNRNLSFNDVFTRIEAEFEPAIARRGETVTWKLTVELIPRWHTYPTKQADPNAQSQVTQIKFPQTGDVTPDGPITEPDHPIKKAEPDLGIKELIQYEGTVVWQQQLVVSPFAAPGDDQIKVPITKFACDESCLPPKKHETTATLTISNAAPLGNNAAGPKVDVTANGAENRAPIPPVDPPADAASSTDHESA